MVYIQLVIRAQPSIIFNICNRGLASCTGQGSQIYLLRQSCIHYFGSTYNIF